jgi:hypothetical protein
MSAPDDGLSRRAAAATLLTAWFGRHVKRMGVDPAGCDPHLCVMACRSGIARCRMAATIRALFLRTLGSCHE